MRSLPLNLKHILKTENPLALIWEIIWAKRSLWARPALILSTVILGLAAGFMTTQLSVKIFVLAVGGIALLFTEPFRAEIVILLILAMTSTIIDMGTTRQFFGFSVAEIGVMFLLALVLLKTLTGDFVRTPLDLPLLLFFGLSTFSQFNAILNLGTVHLFRNFIWRMILFYLIFFAVTNLVTTRRQLMILVGGMFVMATVVAGFIIAQQIVGTNVSIIPGQKTIHSAAALGQEIGGVARVSIPGAAIVYVSLLPVFILSATPEYMPERKWLLFIPAALLPVAIAFTFDRNMWVGATLGGTIFVFTTRLKSKRFVRLILGLVIGAVLFVSLLNVYFPRIDTVVGGLTARFSSLFAGDDLVNDSSTQWRLKENEYAIPKIKENLLLGIGPGGEWRRNWSKTDRLTRYIHNGYFFLLLDVGLVGFIPFLWFSAVHVIGGLSSWDKMHTPVLRAIVMGFTLSYIGILSSSTTSPRLLEMNFVPLLGVIMGINQVAMRLEAEFIQEQQE